MTNSIYINIIFNICIANKHLIYVIEFKMLYSRVFFLLNQGFFQNLHALHVFIFNFSKINKHCLKQYLKIA